MLAYKASVSFCKCSVNFQDSTKHSPQSKFNSSWQYISRNSLEFQEILNGCRKSAYVGDIFRRRRRRFEILRPPLRFRVSLLRGAPVNLRYKGGNLKFNAPPPRTVNFFEGTAAARRSAGQLRLYFQSWQGCVAAAVAQRAVSSKMCALRTNMLRNLPPATYISWILFSNARSRRAIASSSSF